MDTSEESLRIKRKRMSDMNEKSDNVLNLFYFVENGQINLDDEKVENFIEECFGLEMKRKFYSDPIVFLQDEENKSEFYSLFYHSYETNEENKKNNQENNENDQKRYFADTRICYRCGLTGHIDAKCPDKNKSLCILCGCIDHQRFNCPQLVCSRCGMCGHRFRDCKEQVDQRRRFNLCNRCPNRHTIYDCPSHWRRYKIYDIKDCPIKMSCCYCLGEDHFIDDCQIRKTKNSIFTERYEEIVFNRPPPRYDNRNRFDSRF